MANDRTAEVNEIIMHLLENNAVALRPFLNPTQLQSFRSQIHDVSLLELKDVDRFLPFHPEPNSEFLNSALDLYGTPNFNDDGLDPVNDDGLVIIVSPSRWDSSTAPQREALIFHQIAFHAYLEKKAEYPITRAFFDSRKKFWKENWKDFQHCELNLTSNETPPQHVVLNHHDVTLPLSKNKNLTASPKFGHPGSVPETLTLNINGKIKKVITISAYDHLDNGISSAGSVYEFMPDDSHRVQLQCFR